MIKKHHRPITFARVSLLVFTLCVLCGLCVKTNAQTFTQVHPGVEHAQVEHKLGSDPVKINLLRLDLKKVRLDVHHALDKAIGLETTSSIATRKGAIAAINAGFFRLDKSAWAGDAAGILKIDGNLLSEAANNRISVSIRNEKKKTDVKFSHATTRSGMAFSKEDVLHFDGINRERKPNEVVLFTPDFNGTTLTPPDGLEIVLTKCNKVFRWWCANAEISQDLGDSSIPQDGLIVSIGKDALDKASLFLKRVKGKAPPRALDQLFRVARVIEVPDQLEQEFLSKAEDITNGVSQLIKNGKIDTTWEQEKASKAFAETRHPRTAVAKLKDGKFLMMTVDGRQPGVSVGMSLQELAEYLFSLGAIDAMNLDGGGSTTMFLDGKVVNKPSDASGERKIGDAIVVTLRNKKK